MSNSFNFDLVYPSSPERRPLSDPIDPIDLLVGEKPEVRMCKLSNLVDAAQHPVIDMLTRHNPALAEDAFQDGCINLQRNPFLVTNKATRIATPTGLVMTYCYLALLALMRREANQLNKLTRFARSKAGKAKRVGADDLSEPEIAAIDHEQVERIESALNQLHPRYRTILELCSDHRVVDVAEHLGLPAGTVRMRLYHARLQLRTQLGSQHLSRGVSRMPTNTPSGDE